MTPKEKAKELYDKFNLPSGLMTSEVKQCALIAVDEIIGQAECNRCYDFDKEYYEQVKQEIEKL